MVDRASKARQRRLAMEALFAELGVSVGHHYTTHKGRSFQVLGISHPGAVKLRVFPRFEGCSSIDIVVPIDVFKRWSFEETEPEQKKV